MYIGLLVDWHEGDLLPSKSVNPKKEKRHSCSDLSLSDSAVFKIANITD